MLIAIATIWVLIAKLYAEIDFLYNSVPSLL